MLPIALALGSADMRFRSPMAVAVAVIGGLLTSTVLSLLVVPAVFTYVDDLGQWARRGFKRRTSAALPPTQASGAPAPRGAGR